MIVDTDINHILVVLQGKAYIAPNPVHMTVDAVNRLEPSMFNDTMRLPGTNIKFSILDINKGNYINKLNVNTFMQKPGTVTIFNQIYYAIPMFDCSLIKSKAHFIRQEGNTYEVINPEGEVVTILVNKSFIEKKHLELMQDLDTYHKLMIIDKEKQNDINMKFEQMKALLLEFK